MPRTDGDFHAALYRPRSTGGNLGQSLGDEFFLPSPKLKNFWGRRGTHCILELYVG